MLSEASSELSRRRSIAMLIDRVIAENIGYDRRQKLRRGHVQTLVCEALGVQQSSRTRTLVNERMDEAGFPKVMIRGVAYYRYSFFRKTCVGLPYHERSQKKSRP